MGYTKRQIVEGAFSEIGIASYVFDVQSDAYQDAMRRLDAMLAEWNGRGIRLGYPIPSTPEGGDLDDEAEVPDRAWEACITNLALRIAPTFGKKVMRETKVAAKQALQTLMSVRPPEKQLRIMPVGAGNKPNQTLDGEYTRVNTPLDAGNDGKLEFN